MSKEQRNSKSIKYTTTSNESLRLKDIIPTQTTKTMTAESYQYFNQQSLPGNNITERSYNSFNQKSNSKNTSIRQNKQNLNSRMVRKKKVIQGNLLSAPDKGFHRL